MEKIKTTNKAFSRYCDVVLSAGCCDLQYIAQSEEPHCYNCGVYGWNWDGYVFYIDGKWVGITTGYRNMIGKTIPQNIIEEYAQNSKEIEDTYRFARANEYEKMSSALRENLDNFLRAAIAAI